jgi:hypothetical protein
MNGARAFPGARLSERWCFFLSEVREAVIRDGPWHGGGGHSNPQACVDDIDVDVGS